MNGSFISDRALLISYQNQISWIASEFAKIKREINEDGSMPIYDENLCILLYENLNTIVAELKENKLNNKMSLGYKKICNDMLVELRDVTMKKISIGYRNQL